MLDGKYIGKKSNFIQQQLKKWKQNKTAAEKLLVKLDSLLV